MGIRIVARAVLTGIVLSMLLFSYGGVSHAEAEGATLSATLGIEAVGETASATVDDVSVFSPTGGAAVFEPGTANEEPFQYASIDPETNRLVGLSRTAPVPHDIGSFVAIGGATSPLAPVASAAPLETTPLEAEAPPLEEVPQGDLPVECVGDQCGATDVLDMVGLTCELGACDATRNPLGAWSACDLDRADGVDETCPDPQGVIDVAWDVEADLSDLECEASVSGPGISTGGGMTIGRGSFDCNEFVTFVEITVCLHRNLGGGWTEMGCRYKKKMISEGGVSGSVSKKIAEPCTPQQEALYKIRARGRAVDGGGEGTIDEERDSATATAKLYCPGTSVDGAARDALEYAESWLPTDA